MITKNNSNRDDEPTVVPEDVPPVVPFDEPPVVPGDAAIKSAPKKTPVKKSPAKKSPVKKTATKKAAEKKTATKKATVKKSPAKKTAAKTDGNSAGSLPPAKLDEFEQMDAFVDQQINAFEKETVKLGKLLSHIKARKLYKAKFKTWEDYVASKADISRQHAYRLITHYEVVDMLGEEVSLSPTGDILVPTSENQTRKIIRLKNQDDQVKAWEDAIKLAGGNQPASSDIEKAVEERLASLERKKRKDGAVDAVIVSLSKVDNGDEETGDGNRAAVGNGTTERPEEIESDAAENGRANREDEPGGKEDGAATEPTLESGGTEGFPAANAQLPPAVSPVLSDPGTEGVPGWEDAELADGSVIRGAVCPDGYITATMVKTDLGKLNRKITGQNEKIALQKLLLEIFRLANETAKATPGAKSWIKRLFKEVLPNLPLG